MQFEGLPRPWSLSREAEGMFASQKRHEALAPVADSGTLQEGIQCTEAIMEDL
jgi:hypothetical protein